MTRIITEKYKCANCGNDLSRHKVTSFSTFFDAEDILECKGTFVGVCPKLYFCYNCGYIGEDLSKEPDDKIKEIINTEDYKFFMEIGDKYNPYFNHFLLAVLLTKLEKYKEAIPHFACSNSSGHSIFPKESKIYDLLDQRDVDIDIIADNTKDLGNLFVNELIVDCTKHIDFHKISDFLQIYASIDALRRTRKIEDAQRLIAIALEKDFSSLEKNLLKEEQELCSKGDILTVIKIVEESVI